MEKKTNRIIVICGFVLVFVVYSVCLLMLADLTKISLWIGYAFTLVAFLLGGAMLWFDKADPLDAKSYIYQVPLSRLCVTYDLITMVLGIILAVLPGKQIKIPFIVELIILAIFVILEVSCILEEKKVTGRMQKTDEKVVDLRLMESRLKTIANNCADAALEEKINLLAEDFHFSDPMSNEEVSGMDRALYGQISELQELIKNGDTMSALVHVQALENSLKERNRLCKISHGERS
jgi:hypothetical protein